MFVRSNNPRPIREQIIREFLRQTEDPQGRKSHSDPRVDSLLRYINEHFGSYSKTSSSRTHPFSKNPFENSEFNSANPSSSFTKLGQNIKYRYIAKHFADYCAEDLANNVDFQEFLAESLKKSSLTPKQIKANLSFGGFIYSDFTPSTVLGEFPMEFEEKYMSFSAYDKENLPTDPEMKNIPYDGIMFLRYGKDAMITVFIACKKKEIETSTIQQIHALNNEAKTDLFSILFASFHHDSSRVVLLDNIDYNLYRTQQKKEFTGNYSPPGNLVEADYEEKK